MTAEDPGSRSSATVEQAINQVLQAERGAAQAVESCRQDALRILQDAQQRAKRIALRTDERLATCHLRCNSKLTRDIREHERLAAAGQVGESSYRLDAAALSAVVEALALTLTGEPPTGTQSRNR